MSTGDQGAGTPPAQTTENAQQVTTLQVTPPAQTAPSTPPAQTTETPPQTTPAPTKALDWDAFSGEVARDGKLSDGSMLKLTEAGIPKEVVDRYVASLRTEPSRNDLAVNQETDVLLKEAGGEQTFKAMQSWMASNLPPHELAAFNKAVTEGDLTIAKLAMAGMKARYDGAVGSEPQLLLEGGEMPTGMSAFESQRQFVDAFKDPRYKSDPAYRAQVQARAALSNV